MTYSFEDIKFAVDRSTFERAVGLYEKGKVTGFREAPGGYESVVLGGQLYHVFVSARQFDHGTCDCYLGQKDMEIVSGPGDDTVPVEATAIGNLLVQALGSGEFSSLGEARQLIARSFPLTTVEPQTVPGWDEAYGKFCRLTG